MLNVTLRARLALLALFCGCATPPPAPRPSGEKDVLDALEARARDVLAEISHPVDRASWERAVPRLRRRLLDSLGLERLPKPRPRDVRTVGTLDRGEYTIEKLVYGTLPGVDVPAHLYLPKRIEGKLPAVLFVPGHWYADSKARPDFQAFCVSMALRGFAVLAYDPFGQGERGISLRDHRRTELLLVGVAQQAIVDFESLCALELLLARPEVDADRIGITGASGGGYNSWIMAALDPRIKVAVPVVGTSEFLEQLSVVRERDWYDAKEHCHFIPGLLRYANNHEFLAMIAPRPVLVIAAHNDHSFRIPGNRLIVEYGSKLYSVLGADGKIGYFEDESEGHGYGKKKREAACGWFLKWLKGEADGSPAPEPSLKIPPWDAPELRCFPPGENLPAGPGLVALAKSLLPPEKPSWAPPRSVIRKSLVDVLGCRDPRETPSIARAGPRLSWKSDGLEIPAVIVEPRGEWKGTLLAAADAGKESLREHPAVRAALDSGLAVVFADPRGMGELATTKPGWTFATSLLLGENFTGLQAEDLAAGLRALHGKPVGLLGVGRVASAAALYAAILEPRAAWLVTDGGFASYRSFIERPRSMPRSYTLALPGEEKTVKIDREIPASLVVFDVLRRFDLSDLYAAVLPRPVLVMNPIDGDFEPADGNALLARSRHAWKARPEVGTPAAEFIRKAAARPVPTGPVGMNISARVPRGPMPARVHVVEDYSTEIEKRWWLCGRPENGACRGTPAHDFDDKMGDPSRVYTAVVFNPVPGPPMGNHTRLAFRCSIKGSDRLRVQIYSLSNGYHRHLTLEGLKQGEWQDLTVDMTQARRPDGSGGPLAQDERIDDIQFYASPDAELLIDDIVLYDAARPDEREPFPKRAVFTAWFDTGRQGQEWPGEFEIVNRAAKSIAGCIRLHLRGERPLSTAMRLRCRAAHDDTVSVTVACTRGETHRASSGIVDVWREVTIDLGVKHDCRAVEVVLAVSKDNDLFVDDVLLYEPGGPR